MQWNNFVTMYCDIWTAIRFIVVRYDLQLMDMKTSEVFKVAKNCKVCLLHLSLYLGLVDLICDNWIVIIQVS
jgi:hypothetical protein